MTVIDPDYRRRNEHIPPVRIEKMTVEGQTVDLTVAPVIGPGRKKLEFTFTALSFLVPEKNRFKTWLRGFDSGWSAETSQRQVSYTNLPPGRYTFRVIACNNDGKWNRTGASLRFRSCSRFSTRHSGSGSLSFSACCCWRCMAFRWRFKRLQRREKELETLVKERTGELSRGQRGIAHVQAAAG